MVELLKENRHIYEKTKRRTSYQLQLFKYTDLHEHIFSFVSNPSASGSLKGYAKAIAFVAEQALERLDRRGAKELHATADKLKFLFYKQKANPGFDLHQACYLLFKNEEDERLSVKLPRILNKIQEMSAAKIFDSDTSVAEEELKALSLLFEKASIIIEKNRIRIAENFMQKYHRWWYDNTGSQSDYNSIIVTQGYSKTVREVLKRVVFNEGKQFDFIKDSSLPRILVMKPNENGAIESRLLMFELKEF